MSTKEIRISKSLISINYEVVSHIMVILVLLFANVIFGLYVLPGMTVLIDGRETVHKAKEVVAYNSNEILDSLDFSLEPIQNEFAPEIIMDSVKEINVSKTIVETNQNVVPEETIKPEEFLPDDLEPAVPVFDFKGSLEINYCVGSTIDFNAIELLLDGEVISLEECDITGADTTSPGEYWANITYGEYSVEIPYIVVDYRAVLHGMGEEKIVSLVNYELDTNVIRTPAKLGKEFTGWYRDEACTVPFVSALHGEITLDLYAGWKDFDRFTCDDAGYITTYTGAFGSITDGLLNLPAHPSCIGVRADAFMNLEEFVTDIYIPANITRIESGAFDCLPYVFYIYVHPDNPVYSSDSGILYTKDMSVVVAYPKGR